MTKEAASATDTQVEVQPKANTPAKNPSKGKPVEQRQEGTTSQEQGRRANGAQNNGQNRRTMRPMSKEEDEKLQVLLRSKMGDERAKRELLNALSRPQARFVAFSNGMVNQLFRINQDLDRVMSQADRLGGIDAAKLEKKHEYEKRIVKLTADIADLTGEIALNLDRRDLITDPRARDFFDRMKKESKSKDDAS